MRLKLKLDRLGGSKVDIVITADASTSIGQVASAIVAADPTQGNRSPTKGASTLRATLPGAGTSVTLPPDGALGESWVASGASVSVVSGEGRFSPADAGSEPASAYLKVMSEGGGGAKITLKAGSSLIGRDPSCDVVINDLLVSKVHARIVVNDSVEIVDLNSANGIIVESATVTRARIRTKQIVQLGDTLIEIGVLKRGHVTNLGPIQFTRSPRVEPRFESVKLTPPEMPAEREPQPFPVIAMVAPLIAGAGFFLLTQSTQSLLFMALSPVLMVANWISGVFRQRAIDRKALAKFNSQLSDLEGQLADRSELERSVRLAEVPSVTEVYEDCLRLGPLMWTRRPEHWTFLVLRLGTGSMPSRTQIEPSAKRGVPSLDTQIERLRDRFEYVTRVPIIESPMDAGAIGLVGESAEVADVARALLVQLSGLHSPADLTLCALVGASWAQEFEWLKWLPHTGSPLSPLEGVHLADSPATGAAVIAQLEELIAGRATKPQQRGARQRAESVGLRSTAPVDKKDEKAFAIPAVVVVITDDCGVDPARLNQLSERAADAGVFPIWIASDVQNLPAVCRTYVEISGGRESARVGLVRLGERVADTVLEGLSRDAAEAFARHLAPVVDAGARVDDASDIPRSVNLLSILGPELASSSSAVVDRWTQNDSIHDRAAVEPRPRTNAGKLRALVGQSGIDAMHLDLRTQGPHALVGGTTGSGKSEFLQAWVLSMASEYSPDRVTFLFVDYKGGSAFADCVNLPHCVGLVTDLGPHLVRRALTSLRAELHHREHLFNRKKAKDLLELERRGDIESPPALVLVIDEFAALAKEFPDFVDGVVDIAQRGRSLGIHLIMATQRPAGVIRDNLRANTNMRIALRMADESDSQDVINDSQAAFFDPAVPGRAVVKTGPGRLSGFQSAYAGGWTLGEPAPSSVAVASLRFGVEEPWVDKTSVVKDAPKDPGPTDQQRLVRSVTAAAREAAIPAPRRPWLDELAPVYDLLKLRQRSDTEIVLGVADVPELQDQQTKYFRPDLDGSLAVYGTSGSGKSTLLRTLAAAAGITPRSGPVEVFGLDFGSGGLRMLEDLPHVGSIIAGDDTERISRLLLMIREKLDHRSVLYAAVNASSITEFRELAQAPLEPRILLLIDNFGVFREQYDVVGARSQLWTAFQRIVAEGRPLGIHAALSADRPAAIPSALVSNIQCRVVLRMADKQAYGSFPVPADILSPASPVGRAIVDGLETQVAVLGASTNMSEQAAVSKQLAALMLQAKREKTGAIGALPVDVKLGSLPVVVEDQPVLGISDEQLAPIGFDPVGVMLLAGPPGSGRTTALATLTQSMRRAHPETELFYMGNKRSSIGKLEMWNTVTVTAEEVAELAEQLTERLSNSRRSGRIMVVVEGISEFVSTAAESPLTSLVKAIKRSDDFLLAESETSSWASSWSPLSDVKSARRGLILRPESHDGDSLLRTAFPRVTPTEFPPGRGLYVEGGKVRRVHLPLPD